MWSVRLEYMSAMVIHTLDKITSIDYIKLEKPMFMVSKGLSCLWQNYRLSIYVA